MSLPTATTAVTDSGGIADRVTSTISRSLSNYAAIENLTLLGSALVGVGSNLGNRITGNALNNTLTGAAGNDVLIGAGGDRPAEWRRRQRQAGRRPRQRPPDRRRQQRRLRVRHGTPCRDQPRPITDFSHVDDSFHLENAVFARLTAVQAR